MLGLENQSALLTKEIRHAHLFFFLSFPLLQSRIGRGEGERENICYNNRAQESKEKGMLQIEEPTSKGKPAILSLLTSYSSVCVEGGWGEGGNEITAEPKHRNLGT